MQQSNSILAPHQSKYYMVKRIQMHSLCPSHHIKAYNLHKHTFFLTLIEPEENYKFTFNGKVKEKLSGYIIISRATTMAYNTFATALMFRQISNAHCVARKAHMHSITFWFHNCKFAIICFCVSNFAIISTFTIQMCRQSIACHFNRSNRLSQLVSIHLL